MTIEKAKELLDKVVQETNKEEQKNILNDFHKVYSLLSDKEIKIIIKYNILNVSIRKIDNMYWGDLDILNEYLFSKSMIKHYLKNEEDKECDYYYILKAFMELDQFGRKSLINYVMYRKNRILSERQ